MKSTHMKIVSIAAAAILGLQLIASCISDDRDEELTTRASTIVSNTAVEPLCDDARSLWELTEEGWSRLCLDQALKRDTAAWAHNNERLIGLGPQGCTRNPEPLHVTTVSGDHVEVSESQLSSSLITKGTGVAVDEIGNTHTYGGEWCATTNAGLHVELLVDGSSTQHVFRPELVWPVVMPRDGKILVSSGLALRMGELDLFTDPGLDFKPNPFCFFIHPDGPGESQLPRFCGLKTGEFVPAARKKGTWFSRADVDGKPILPPGRELTWVYDAKHDRIVSVAFFEPNMWASSEMDPTPLLWKVDRRAWTIPKEGKASQLPDPPIIGDGVTLLYNPELEQVILFDPFGTKSWSLAADDSAWEEWRTHEPLPLPEGVTLPENTRGTEHRFTQWWAPYFAYWDVERGGPTVVFYDEPHSLCLPVDGLGDTYACPKSHS